MAFSSYLGADCGLTPSVILSIAEGLLNKPEVSMILGVKLITFWLLFKIYGAFNIQGGQYSRQKRKKLANLFYTY
jgi:hypothetical protein